MSAPGADVVALVARARQLQRGGRGAEAADAFRDALAAWPADPELWYEFGYHLKHLGRADDALAAFGEALARGITRAHEVHLNRAILHSDHLRRDDDAERELRAALALAPDYVPALLNLGNLQEERGERDAALSTYDRLLDGPASADPAQEQLRDEALARSAQLRPPADAGDPVFARIEAAVGRQANPIVRANLLFSLGRLRERLGDVDAAFDAFARANRWVQRGNGRRYDPAAMARHFDAIIAATPATPAAAIERAGDDAAGPAPIFVCGMFRSGSTLVEQVLAAHPMVEAGGELPLLPRLASVDLAPFPQSLATLDDARATALAARYRAMLAQLFPDAAADGFVTDKRPDNFTLLGLAKRLFPRAKIVHTRRHPLDTGLSVFAHHLQPQVAPYACELADIGHYTGQYRRLMAHWHQCWPGDVFDFDYDAFVADPRPALEALLDFLGLPWDDRCLAFHRERRTVKTASYWQVREPLHRGASGRWRRYGHHLDPLRQALVSAGVADAARD